MRLLAGIVLLSLVALFYDPPLRRLVASVQVKLIAARSPDPLLWIAMGGIGFERYRTLRAATHDISDYILLSDND